MDSQSEGMSSPFDDLAPSAHSWECLHSRQCLDNDFEEKNNQLSIPMDELPDSLPLPPEKIQPESSLITEGTEGFPKQKKVKGVSQEKNIKMNIPKVVFKQFLASSMAGKVMRICQKVGCHYKDVCASYRRYKKKSYISLNDLSEMLIPEAEEEVKIKKVFYLFLTWFLRHIYPMYVLTSGKMEGKEEYLSYKNKFFLNLGQLISSYY